MEPVIPDAHGDAVEADAVAVIAILNRSGTDHLMSGVGHGRENGDALRAILRGVGRVECLRGLVADTQRHQGVEVAAALIAFADIRQIGIAVTVRES